MQETLQWLANPANLNADVLPPGLETYDPVPFLSSTGNVFMVTLLPQVRREGPTSPRLLCSLCSPGLETHSGQGVTGVCSHASLALALACSAASLLSPRQP